ncbi:MAG: type I-E CRISPR-associated protein Cse2/CasB [Sulfuricaulis sp.]|uniref:type I-E CRISPR-associated protein Cse2/CasB n=1 Tax=Sulfuricaulis sp. TaxID=2003553 RepID=UPI0034A0DFAF
MTDKEKSLYPFPRRKPDDHSFAVLRSWWQNLESDKGERAALRRAASLTEVMLSPAFHRLLRELRQAGYGISDYRYPKLAAIAGLAARIKGDGGGSLATCMGTPKSAGGKAVVSELRVRRLLACDDIEELYTLLRRALALLDNQANIADLAGTIWNWVPMDEKRPNDPRRQLAYDYYAALPL